MLGAFFDERAGEALLLAEGEALLFSASGALLEVATTNTLEMRLKTYLLESDGGV